MATVSGIIKGDKLDRTYGSRHISRTQYQLQKERKEKDRLSRRRELTDLCKEKIATLKSLQHQFHIDTGLQFNEYRTLWDESNPRERGTLLTNHYEDFRTLWKERDSLTKNSMDFSYYCGLD